MNFLPVIAAAKSGAAYEPDPMGHVLPHNLFGSTWFTNHHLMSLVTLVVGVIVLWWAGRSIRVKPDKGVEGYVTRGPLAQIIEALCVFLRDSMARPLLGNLTDKYIYYIWSTFFFILLANLLGLIPFGPILGLIFGEHAAHFGGTLTGNLAFTGGLAILAFILIHGIALYEQGLNYLKHGFPVPMKPMATKPLFRTIEWCTLVPLLFVVNILVGFLELVLGPVIKAFALAMRLFANMVAGHLVLGSLIILVLAAGALGKGFGIFGAAAFSFLELFVAFLQAYVFTFLTVIFISMGAAHHDEHHEDHAHPEPESGGDREPHVVEAHA